MHRTKRLWLALGLAGLVGCGQEQGAATAVALVIKTDLEPTRELSSVWVRVFAPDADVKTDKPLADFPPQPVSELARPTVITKGGRREFLVAVQGLGPGGVTDPVVEQRLKVRFVDGETVALPVFLARSCLHKPCRDTPGQTCYGERLGVACEGMCGPIPRLEPTQVVAETGDPLLDPSWAPRRCSATQRAKSACEGDRCAGVLSAASCEEAGGRPCPAREPEPESSADDGAVQVVHQALMHDLARTSRNVRVHARPDGLQHVEIVSGFRHATMLVTTPDGGLSGHCTSDARGAMQLLGRSAK